MWRSLFFSIVLVGTLSAQQGPPLSGNVNVGGIELHFPQNWQVQENADSVTVTPANARQRTQDGKPWLTHGLYAGRVGRATNLNSAAESLFRAFKKESPYLVKYGPPEQLLIAGQSAVVQEYVNPEPRAPAPESGLIATFSTSDGFSYVVLFCPSADKPTYFPTFHNILNSIRVAGTQPQWLPGVPSRAVPSGSLIHVEPSNTLLRQTTSVKAGQAVFYNFGLTRGTKLLAQFIVSGGANDKINVLLLDADNYQRYAARQQYRFYEGTTGEVRGLGRYEFDVPNTGLYYVVLDNGRAWLYPR